MIKKTTLLFVILVVVLMSGCTTSVYETPVIQSETIIETISTPTSEPAATLALEPTSTFTPTVTNTPLPTNTPTLQLTSEPVDLYNRLNWVEFYESIPEEWNWEWVSTECIPAIIKSRVSKNPDICITDVAPKNNLETQLYILSLQILDIENFTFVEYIPYLYKGPIDEELSLIEFSMTAESTFSKIFDEVDEYCSQKYGNDSYKVQMTFYTEIEKEEWEYLVDKIPSWNVDIKGLASEEKN